MNKYKFNFFVPLLNFKSDCDHILLNNDISIKKPSVQELKALENSSIKWTGVKKTDYILCITLHKEEPAREPYQYINAARKEIEKTITILRLFKEEIIGYNIIVQKLSEEEHFAFHAVNYFHYRLYISDKSEFFQKRYQINGDDNNSLKDFFNEYFQCSSFQPLELAIEYFTKSYHEPYTPRDSLIDLMITLENLYLKGINDELKFRLALRIAFFLSKDYNKRDEIFNFIKESYNKRSKVVHGEKEKDIDYETLFKLRDIVRESLKIFIKNPNLRDELDVIILKNGDYKID